MKLPEKGTQFRKCIDLIYEHGPMKVSDFYDIAPEMSKESLAKTFGNAVRHGYFSKTEHRNRFIYDLTPRAIRLITDAEKNANYIPEIVQPRRIDVYASSGLSLKYQISANGSREGSNDFRNWPSKHMEAA